MKFAYALLYRPPSFNCLPSGWELVERPSIVPNNFERRTDLPVSQEPFGIVAFDRRLTADEVRSYELRFTGE